MAAGLPGQASGWDITELSSHSHGSHEHHELWGSQSRLVERGHLEGNEASLLSSGPKDLAQSFDGKVKRRVSTSSKVNQWPDIFRQRGQEKPHQSSYHVEGIQGTIPNFSLCANMSSFRNSSLMHFQL